MLREAAVTPNTKRTQRLRGCVIEPRNDEIAGAETANATCAMPLSEALTSPKIRRLDLPLGPSLQALLAVQIIATGFAGLRFLRQSHRQMTGETWRDRCYFTSRTGRCRCSFASKNVSWTSRRMRTSHSSA